MLAVLGGGCQVPIGGYACLQGKTIRLRGLVASPDGSRIIRGERSGDDPETVGVGLGKWLLDNGAAEILGA
jgi:hydroxymethylbilane synthase